MMYSNLSKAQALPMALRVSFESQISRPFSPSSAKLQVLTPGFCPKPSLNPSCTNSRPHRASASSHRTHKPFQLSKSAASVNLHDSYLVWSSILSEKRSYLVGQCRKIAMNDAHLGSVRRFSVSLTGIRGEGGEGVGGGRSTLPWLAESNLEKPKKSGKFSSVKAGRSTWEVSAEKLLKRSRQAPEENETSRSRTFDRRENRRLSHLDVGENVEEDERVGGDEIDDLRWDKIRSRFGGSDTGKEGSRRPVPQRWSRQENWGRKTWREATESTVPKMVGEGVYGVGPVLAALSSGRREFYVLYVQEGLDLSKNNKRKKDKKGFEKVLKMADKISLSIKELSKHDLNMVVDNRPHQGLVLDASPLEMVSVKELDPVSAEHDKGLLWVALDEVTDPQNLGAIIRSSYFFGASGVVLCAKNSAPLSGVVSKASAGSLELMEIRSCKNMMQFLTSSAENGWRVIGGSVSSRATPLHEVPTGAPTLLVLGSEGTGLRPLVERSCTHLVRIPGNFPVDVSIRPLDDEENAETEHQCTEEVRSFMAVESLNVSVAAGVLLHHLIGSKNSGNSNISLNSQGETSAFE